MLIINMELNDMINESQKLKKLRKEYDVLCKSCDDAEDHVFAWNGSLIGQDKVDKMYTQLNILISQIYKLNKKIKKRGV